MRVGIQQIAATGLKDEYLVVDGYYCTKLHMEESSLL